MRTTYLVWKDPNCNGISPNWQEISGKAFLALVRSAEGVGRRFIKLNSTEPGGTDGAIVMEATEAVYADWKRRKNHTDYLRNAAKESITVSYHALEGEDGAFGEELLVDNSYDVEEDFIGSQEPERVHTALSRLSEEEQRMMAYLYLNANQGTERGYAHLTGVPYMTVHDRKVRVLRKLKILLEG